MENMAKSKNNKDDDDANVTINFLLLFAQLKFEISPGNFSL